MQQSISVNYPQTLAYSLKMDNEAFEQEIKVISLVKLYELGKISSSLASELLNIDRVDFLELLAKYKVSYFHPTTANDLASDLNNA